MDPQGMCTQIFSNMFCWFIPYLGNDPIELGKYTMDAMGKKDPLMSNYNDFSLLSVFFVFSLHASSRGMRGPEKVVEIRTNLLIGNLRETTITWLKI